MQAASTRVVSFEMCGTTACRPVPASRARSAPATMPASMRRSTAARPTRRRHDFINPTRLSGRQAEGDLEPHYPGYTPTTAEFPATDASTGARVNLQNHLPAQVAKMNYWMLRVRPQKGFQCNDSFAQYMGADYDTNGDGQVDSDGLRYVRGETEASYVTRVTSTLRGTIRDANSHFVSASSSSDTSIRRHARRVTRRHRDRGLFGGPPYRGAALQRPSPPARARLEPVRPDAWAGASPPPVRRRPDRQAGHGPWTTQADLIRHPPAPTGVRVGPVPRPAGRRGGIVVVPSPGGGTPAPRRGRRSGAAPGHCCTEPSAPVQRRPSSLRPSSAPPATPMSPLPPPAPPHPAHARSARRPTPDLADYVNPASGRPWASDRTSLKPGRGAHRAVRSCPRHATPAGGLRCPKTSCCRRVTCGTTRPPMTASASRPS